MKTNKNIHILETDKPSRLHFNEFEDLLFTTKYEKLDGVNIYITNDEEIKERFSTDNILGHECKKIILTTDQDLIKNGVQAIDDEFLEWFVKNPNCKEVKVEWVKTPDGIFYHQDNVPYGCYKIIIPKQESCTCTDECLGYLTKICKNIEQIPKQETLEEVAYNYAEDKTNRTSHLIGFRNGAKWQQEQIGKSEFLQRLRGTLSDAEARRLIFETFKNK